MLDAHRCWEEVMAREPHPQTPFVYAVRSTGVYCRPSCPSRRPLRDRVQFFATPADARSAGFRPCQRCQPDAEHDPVTALVEQAQHYIETHLEESLSLADLGAALHVSPFHLQRIFKRQTGLSPRQYADAHRRERFKARLKAGADVLTAGFEAGYRSSSSLYEHAQATLGMTPAAYRRGGQGMSITYRISPSALGYLLVAATDRGVCAVSLGDTEGRVEQALKEEYPAATVVRDDAALDEWVTPLLRYLSGQSAAPAVLVDVPGTPFQQRVWRALQEIPPGSTPSYGSIARIIGEPGAARAVARACATNPAALVIPCHRVVREDGAMGGYRWGIERKRRLLALERKAAASTAAPASLARS
jgi:AraC family transcriptional regulator of adaptative response/methylated-DNA-[protein]-cysteine methyltransferase